MIELIIIALRAIQALFALVVLGLTAHGTSSPSTRKNQESPSLTPSPPTVASLISPSQNSFLVFVSVWTILILIYLSLAPRFMASAAHPIPMLPLDALTMLFWFAGFIALAVFRHELSESEAYYGDVFGDIYSASVCGGSSGLLGRWCGELEAAAVFGGLEW